MASLRAAARPLQVRLGRCTHSRPARQGRAEHSSGRWPRQLAVASGQILRDTCPPIGLPRLMQCILAAAGERGDGMRPVRSTNRPAAPAAPPRWLEAAPKPRRSTSPHSLHLQLPTHHAGRQERAEQAHARQGRGGCRRPHRRRPGAARRPACVQLGCGAEALRRSTVPAAARVQVPAGAAAASFWRSPAVRQHLPLPPGSPTPAGPQRLRALRRHRRHQRHRGAADDDHHHRSRAGGGAAAGGDSGGRCRRVRPGVFHEGALPAAGLGLGLGFS